MIKEHNMNIEATKLELMYLLLQANNESLLSKLKRVFDEESNEFYSSDITTLQNRAKASLEAIENGETRPIAEFKAEIDHWKSQQNM
jgi:hypothetical protein